MRSLINTNGQQSDTRWLLDQSRRTSDAQIEHQTESLQDEKGVTLKGLLRKCVRNSMRPHVALQKSARREMPTPGGALSENQKPSPKIPAGDLLRPCPRAIRGLVNPPDFDIPTSDLELFCRAQRRTEITQFVVDLGRSFDGLSNFFAEQRAIAFA